MNEDFRLRKEIHFWKKIVAHATGNCANALSHWKSNPNVNSEFGFGFSASKSPWRHMFMLNIILANKTSKKAK